MGDRNRTRQGDENERDTDKQEIVKELLRFAGILTPEEAELMECAIEEGCERNFSGAAVLARV